MLKIICAGFGILGVITSSQQPIVTNRNAAPVTVCDVLQDLRRYQGQILEVRGEWAGWHLRGNCYSLRLETAKYQWPHHIALEVPGMRPEPFPREADWNGPDSSVFVYALAGARQELERLVPESLRTRAAITVTIVGRFDVRFDERQRDQPAFDRERDVPFGYGSNGLLPARLMMMSFKDIVVTLDGKSLLQWETSGGIPKQ